MSTLDIKQAYLIGLGQGVIQAKQNAELAERTQKRLQRMCVEIKEAIGLEGLEIEAKASLWDESLKIEIKMNGFVLFALTAPNISNGFPLVVNFEAPLCKLNVVNSQEELEQVICDYMSDASVGKRFYEMLQWIELPAHVRDGL